MNTWASKLESLLNDASILDQPIVLNVASANVATSRYSNVKQAQAIKQGHDVAHVIAECPALEVHELDIMSITDSDYMSISIAD